ncbi:MAG: hypothetical protein A2Z70_01820 [Chloroflexi bacterium RBG_13_48_17]|nr:MAG: hypothetical protein A2Z70_01820 [Chloroflexi bacterium RBG_13_48_17]
MPQLLVTVLSMNLATVLMSPLVFAFSSVVLGSKNQSIKKALSMLLGVAVVATGMVLLGIAIGHISNTSSRPSLFSAVLNLAVGILFLLYVIKVIFDKNYGIKKDLVSQGGNLKTLFILGFVLEITNLGAMLLAFHAAQLVMIADINTVAKLVLWIVNVLLFSLPALLPILFYLAFRDIATNTFSKLNQFISRHIRFIIIIVFGLFAILFIENGIRYFL